VHRLKEGIKLANY